MAGRRGRSNNELLARVGRIIALLRVHPGGLTTEELRTRVGYGSVPRASQLRTLNRDLRFLADEGWRIETILEGNSPARRVLRTVDNRFATLFTRAERAQLARAAACAGPAIADALATDLGRTDPAGIPFAMSPADGQARLGICQAAVADLCELKFDYSGHRRAASPCGVILGTTWYLRAMDHDDQTVKTFAVERMQHLTKGPPGSARVIAPAQVGAAIIDPMARVVHPPVQVELTTDPDSLPDVVAALGRGGYRQVPGAEPGTLAVTVTITNLDALPARLFELGKRVRLTGPEQVRAQVATVLSPRSAR